MIWKGRVMKPNIKHRESQFQVRKSDTELDDTKEEDGFRVISAAHDFARISAKRASFAYRTDRIIVCDSVLLSPKYRSETSSI